MDEKMKEGNISDIKNHEMVTGVIVSRKCPTCGHHEVGCETGNGLFVPLRPGDRIGVFPKSPSPFDGRDASRQPERLVDARDEELVEWVPWIPEDLCSDPVLCRKYGVFIDRSRLSKGISPALYETAYREKLEQLIEKETFVPLPVILDRFFAAPHLASGTSKEAANALWEELEEIREPVRRMTGWLSDKSDESLLKMIYPKSREALAGNRLDDAQLQQVIQEMSLEDFLETL